MKTGSGPQNASRTPAAGRPAAAQGAARSGCSFGRRLSPAASFRSPPPLVRVLASIPVCIALLGCQASAAAPAVSPGGASDADRPAGTAPAPRGPLDLRAYAHYAAGVVLRLDGRWDDALVEFRRAHALAPKSPEVALELAQCYQHLNQPNEALAEFERAAQLAPNDFTVQSTLGEVYDRLGRVAPAIEAFQRALDAATADRRSAAYAATVWRLANLAAQTNQTALAAAQYARLLDLILHPLPSYGEDRRLLALAAHPELVAEQLGALYVRLGDLPAAIQAFERGREFAPNSVTLAFRLGEAYLRQKEYAKALTEADRAVALSNNDAAALDLFLKAALGLEKPEEAVRRLEARLRAAPEHPFLRLFLASAYRHVNRLAQAEQLLRAVLDDRPNGIAYAELSATLRQDRRPAAALDTLAEAVDKDAIDQRVLIEMDEAITALRTDTPAAHTWADAAARKTDSPGAQYLLGSLRAEERQYDLAAQAFNRVIQLAPSFLWAYVHLADLYARRKEHAKALDVYRRAQGRGLGKDPLVYRMMAYLQERLNQLPEAMKSVDEALRLDSSDRRTLYLRGTLLDRMGRDEDAERTFRHLLAADPNDVQANNALAYFYAVRKRRLDEARTLIDRALRAEPDNGAYLDTLGWVLFQQGRNEEALRVLERAAEAIKTLDPEGDPVILDHLGDVYVKAERPADARRAYARALELNRADPNPELDPVKIQEKLDRLPR
jgi:tetratricopeptide (TPR) repeat protein